MMIAPRQEISPNSQKFKESQSLESAEPAQAWAQVLRKLRGELGEDVFNSWFARLELVKVEADTVHVTVPTKFLKSWLQSHYNDKLLATVGSAWPNVTRLMIGLRTGSRTFTPRDCAGPLFLAAAPEAQLPRSAILHADRSQVPTPEPVSERTRDLPRDLARNAASEEQISGSPLDRRLNFANFLVGRSNQLAHAAASQVARASAGGVPQYNPLYIHSSVGLGKTHVLQAIAHAAGEVGQRVIYLTAEKFMYGFVSSLKSQSSTSFKERLRAIDVLIIDDVQFLQGKAIQIEFCHTLNALIDAGKQVVVAADRPPGDLEALEERVRSRLAGGLCVEMGALDEALRVNILEKRIAAAKVHQPNFHVPPVVVSYIGRTIQTNGRDLDGAINRLLAHSTLSHTPLSIETAEIAIRDLVRTREPKRIKIEDIQKLVASHFNVSRADILSSRRTAQVVKPRQIAMYLAKVLTLRSLPEIGRRFGGRDHTTVLHAVRKIEGLGGSDHDLAEELELLKRMLME